MRQQHRRRFATWSVISLGVLLQACAAPQRQTIATEWQGRLSIQVHAEPPTSMSAGFSLRGNARHGELDLFSPLGTTLGALQWSPQTVQLIQSGSRQNFESLSDLTEKTMGAALPIDAMFQWIQGNQATASGWQADLSSAPQGVVTARRTAPLPEVSLRIKLD